MTPNHGTPAGYSSPGFSKSPRYTKLVLVYPQLTSLVSIMFSTLSNSFFLIDSSSFLSDDVYK